MARVKAIFILLLGAMLHRSPCRRRIKRAHVCGASDKHGMYPDENPIKPDGLAATMYHLLGIRHDTEIFDTQDRPLPIAAGEPIADIIS